MCKTVFMTDDIKTQNFKVGKQTLLCKIRPYYVNSQGFFFIIKTPLLLVSQIRKDPWNAWKKKTSPVKFRPLIHSEPVKLWHYDASRLGLTLLSVCFTDHSSTCVNRIKTKSKLGKKLHENVFIPFLKPLILSSCSISDHLYW